MNTEYTLQAIKRDNRGTSSSKKIRKTITTKKRTMRKFMPIEDPEQLLGSNNLVYPGTSMPNVLVALQGSQMLDKDGKIETKSEGSLSKEEFDDSMKDLVNFLAYASEPARITREKNGIFVILLISLIIFLSKFFFVLRPVLTAVPP